MLVSPLGLVLKAQRYLSRGPRKGPRQDRVIKTAALPRGRTLFVSSIAVNLRLDYESEMDDCYIRKSKSVGSIDEKGGTYGAWMMESG